jgi:hypothetical protein
MQMPVIFIVGPAGHGKSASREIVSKITHMKGGSCSDVIYTILAARRGVSVASLREIPKEELRPLLIELGDWLCDPTAAPLSEAAVNPIDVDIFRAPSILIRTLYLNGYNVIDGVRRRVELQHAKGHLEWNGVRAVTIHVSDPRKPAITDNTEDLTDLADNVIVNDGTLEQLEEKLIQVLDQHFPGAREPHRPAQAAQALADVTP